MEKKCIPLNYPTYIELKMFLKMERHFWSWICFHCAWFKNQAEFKLFISTIELWSYVCYYQKVVK